MCGSYGGGSHDHHAHQSDTAHGRWVGGDVKLNGEEIYSTYDALSGEVVIRIPRSHFRLYKVTPSDVVLQIIAENQEQPTALLWARNQVKRNNRRRFGL